MPDSQSAKLVGNLPYYLTGRLLRIIGERTAKPARCVFTLQREVAERLAAQPPRMNRLAAIIQFWAHPRILGRLSPDDFTPRPEIDSAIVCLDTLREHSFEMSKYSQVVRILYRQPRKTVVNNLASGLALSREEILKKLWAASIPPTARPQDVSTQELIRLARLLSHGGNLS